MIVIENPNPEDHLRTEWLLANGLGGYAMGTVLGVNTRRYHGLLVAATRPPVGRIVALHSMIEQLIIPRADGAEEVIDLSTQMFVGPDGEPMLHPDGWKRLRRFAHCDSRGSCIWQYEAEGIELTRTVFPNLNSVENDVRILYELQSDRPVMLRVRPLCAMRNFHWLRTSSTPIPELSDSHSHVRLESPECGMRFDASCRFRREPQMWFRFVYIEESHRGLDGIEDLWSPGTFEKSSEGENSLCIDCVATGVRDAFDLSDPATHHPDANEVPARMAAAASAFVVRRQDDPPATSIMAGYPWFADWGRDAMIALPGLLLCTNRFDEARSVLETFARHMRNGLIPNRFDDERGEAHYNTVDASLWFVYAVWQYLRAVQHTEARSEESAAADDEGRGHRASPSPPSSLRSSGGASAFLFNACRAIISAYRAGTDFNIHMDSDGLIAAGNENTQLTWMDAKRDGIVFTPRHGKAVEINALWFNALHCLADRTDDTDEARELRELAARAGESFRDAFWWSEKNCLHDVLVPRSPRIGIRGSQEELSYAPDDKLRPNQIFAASLPHSPLSHDRQRAVLDCVRERFVTPHGLRTLDRDDPEYQPRFEGDLFARDRAYHNGTVWPWLIGPYCEALLRVNHFSREAKAQAGAAIQPLLEEMEKTTGARCLGQIAEVYDGDPPHRPAGCTAQAWSVAGVLRINILLQEGTTDAHR